MMSLSDLHHFFSRLGESLYPATCECCGNSLVQGEQLLCLHCLYNMPRTDFHLLPSSEIHKRIAAPGLPIDRTASMFHYIKDSPYSRLIQNAKYNNRPDIVRHLAALFSRELRLSGFFDGIDILLPIPLHYTKFLQRGYNQSMEIARTISSIADIPIGDNLKARPHSTQTHKNAIERIANMAGIIKVTHPDDLHNKHILLIDDVITTGATLLTAAKAIHSISPSTHISVLTLTASKLT